LSALVLSGWPWEAVIIVGFFLIGLITGVFQPLLSPMPLIVTSQRPQIMVISTVAKIRIWYDLLYQRLGGKNGFILPAMLLMAITVGFVWWG
jgi:hypothetical protein